MTHEYGDPMNSDAFDKAVEITVLLARKAPHVPLSVHVDNAVHQSFCSCAIDIEDQIEHGISGVHASIAREVRQRVDDQLTRSSRIADFKGE